MRPQADVTLSLESAERIPSHRRRGAGLALTLLAVAAPATAVETGSTGADGALAPSVSTEIQLPEDGVLNYTDIDIPAGVTVRLLRNARNTPAVLLATGDVTIAGTLDASGEHSTPVGAAGDGALGDDGIPGRGGPGGFDGGSGGQPEGEFEGADGLGPGAGRAGWGWHKSSYPAGWYRLGGAGGGFGATGTASWSGVADGGTAYGSTLLLPLIGGSGGGGGAGGDQVRGSGGGGGGGAVLIASPGTVTVTGAIRADGGASGASAGSLTGGTGGGGSGGSIRIVADRIAGNGVLSVAGGAAGTQSGTGAGYNTRSGGSGARGRIRLEAAFHARTASVTPTEALSLGEPGELFISGLPTLRIASVAGQPAPAYPTGSADIQLPADAAGPVTVELEATGIPVGPAVTVTVRPPTGASYSALSNALEGNTELSTASVDIELPTGASTLLATVTYVLLADAADLYEAIAGEPVKALRIEAGLTGRSGYVLITESGREIPVSAARLAAAG